MAANQPKLFIALYTDENIDGRLAEQLRARGYDAISTFEAKNRGLSDARQFVFAISQQRAILTQDAGDFAALFNTYWERGRLHYGLIISEKLPIGELLRRCTRLLESVTADEMHNSFKNLGEFK